MRAVSSGWLEFIGLGLICMLALSLWAQSVAGLVVYNQEQLEHGQEVLDWLGYVGSADFWNRTPQNWQSEFLAVGSIMALSVYLRQRGSSESKPVGTPISRRPLKPNDLAKFTTTKGVHPWLTNR